MYLANTNTQLQSELQHNENFTLYADLIPVAPKKLRGNKESFSAAETALLRRRIGQDVAEKLVESAFYLDSPEAIAETIVRAALIKETESEENLYFSVNQTNRQTGEKFNGYGSLSVCSSSQASPSYQASQTRRRANRIYKSLIEIGVCDENRRLLVRDDGSLKNFPQGYRLRHGVLQSPNLKCDEELDALIHKEAVVLFKKTTVWKKAVLSGYVKWELTEGKAEFIHTNHHSHFLVVAKWIAQADFENTWTDCYQSICDNYNVEFMLPSTVEKNRLNVWINDVFNYATKNGKSLDGAVSDMAAYTAKGTTFLNFPVETMAKVERIMRGRMLEPYGLFNRHKGKKGQLKAENSNDKTLVHNRTQLTSSKKTPRQKSAFIQRGIEAFLSGTGDEWLIELKKREKKRRAFRRQQLAFLNPDAVFFTLSGESFSSSDFIHREKPLVKYYSAFSDRKTQMIH